MCCIKHKGTNDGSPQKTVTEFTWNFYDLIGERWETLVPSICNKPKIKDVAIHCPTSANEHIEAHTSMTLTECWDGCQDHVDCEEISYNGQSKACGFQKKGCTYLKGNFVDTT